MIAYEDFDSSRGPGPDRGNANEIAEEQTKTSAPKKSAKLHENYNNLIAIARQCPRSPFFPTQWGAKTPAPGWKWKQQHLTLNQLVETMQYHGIAMDFTGTGHVAIDCDTAASYPIFIKVFGKHPSEVQTPQWTSGGKIDDTEEIKRQVLFALPSGLEQARIAFSGNAIDVRGDGCYSVMPTGSPHPKTGRPYFWLKEPTKYAIAQLTEQQLEQFRLLAEQSKGSTKKSDRAATPEWTKTVQGWGERYRQFKAGDLLASELTPTEYCDFVLTPIAGWQLVLGYGSGHGFKKVKGHRYVTSPDEYRATSSGESITVDPERIAPDMAIYRAHDRGIQGGHYMGAPLLVLKRRGIDNPTFALKVAIVNEMAEVFGAPKYEPEVIGSSHELTSEEIQEFLAQNRAIVRGEAECHRSSAGEKCGYNAEVAQMRGAGLMRNIGLRANCGTGKSQVIKTVIAAHEKDALAIFSRRSLVREAAQKYGLNHYDDLDNLTEEQLRINGLAICADSLDKLANKFSQWQPKAIVMDEVDSTLKHINRSQTEVSNKRSLIRSILTNYFRRADEIIVASHDLTKAEIEMLAHLRSVPIEAVDVTERVPDRPLTVHDCNPRTFLERIFENIVAKDDGRAVPAAHFIPSDSKKFTRIFGALVAGKDRVIQEQGDDDEIASHDEIMAELPSEIAYMRDRIHLLIVNANTVKKTECVKFLADPTRYSHEIARLGKTLIVVASPSVGEGISVLPHEGGSYVYEVIFSDRLSKEQACQQPQRYRGAAETHLWLDPKLREERDLPVYTLAELMESEKVIEWYAKEDRQLHDATLNYLCYKEIQKQIHDVTGKNPDRMTDEERGAAVSQLLYKLDPRWKRHEILNALFCANVDPWLEYDLKIRQRENWDRRNYKQAIVDCLLAQGFYLTDYSGSIDETDDRSYLDVKAVVKATDTRWFYNGLSEPERFGEYENIKDELANSEDLQERDFLELQGAKLGHEFPGATFTPEQAQKEMRGAGTTYAAKQRAIATSEVFTTDRKRKRLAKEIADEHREHRSLVDNRKANEQVVRHQFLNKIGFFDVLDSEAIRMQYTRESEELELLVKAANKPSAKKMAKALRISVPRVGQRKKYLRFFGTLLRWVGLSGQNKKLRGQVVSKYPQDHDEQPEPIDGIPIVTLEGESMQDPTVERFAIFGLDELEAQTRAYTRFLTSRYNQQVSRIQSVRDLYAQVISEENRLANDISNKSKSNSPEINTPQVFQPTLDCKKNPAANTASELAPAPAGAPHPWAIGAVLKVTAAACHLYKELVELVEWVYHESFDMWSVKVRSQAGETLITSPSWVALH